MVKLITKASGFFLILCVCSFQLNGQFTNVSSSAGITMVHDGESVSEYMDVGSGVAWLDYNNDGFQDLYITMRTGANYLYENNGDGTFTDVAASANAQDVSGDGAGVAAADFNNDGNIDLYLANGNEDVLLKNNGDGTFTDITSTTGLNVTGDRRGTSASWGDYDSDGYLDLFVSHHRPVGTTTYPSTQVQDFLFHNNGDETFTDVSSFFSAADLEGHGFIGGWTDYDNDGDADIILVNDCLQIGPGAGGGETKVFRNDGGTDGVNNWSFTEVGYSLGIIDPEDPTISDCRNGMGLAVGDLNRDGWMDFYYTNIGHVVLYKNNGDGTFADISTSAGVETQPTSYFSWGASFVDYDLDGYQDIITAIGTLNNDTITNPQNNMLFHNNGDDTFTDVAPAQGLDDINKTRHIVYADYDKDGDPDFLVMNYGETPMLKRNDINNGNNYLIVDLVGVESNSYGIGSKLKMTLANGTIQYFETRSGSNLGGGDAIQAYFGLGTQNFVTELEITWPSGIVQVEENITGGQVLSVSEDTSLPIELSSFTATQKEKEIVLEWTTLSESENGYFSIQRSATGGTFQEIGRVLGNGTTTDVSMYKFINEQPLRGNNYYRIRQTDFDGSASFSEVRFVQFEQNSVELNVYPNPVKGAIFTINYSGGTEELNFTIFDVYGKQIESGKIQNDTSMEIPFADLSKGIYMLKVSNKEFQDTRIIIN